MARCLSLRPLTSADGETGTENGVLLKIQDDDAAAGENPNVPRR